MPLLINVMLSTIYMLFMSRHYTSITQCRCYFTPLYFHFNLSTKSMRFRAILYNFLSLFCLLHTTSLSMFFTLYLLTTQTKSLPPSHKIVVYFIPFIITSTFAENVIQLPTSTPFSLAFTPQLLLILRPTFLISTLIIYCYYCLIMFYV